jgi:putative redox protein
MHLHFEKMEVDVDARQKDGAPTITDVHFTLKIKTHAIESKVEKCIEHTMNTCPVGVLFRQAGINITHEVVML